MQAALVSYSSLGGLPFGRRAKKIGNGCRSGDKRWQAALQHSTFVPLTHLASPELPVADMSMVDLPPLFFLVVFPLFTESITDTNMFLLVPETENANGVLRLSP